MRLPARALLVAGLVLFVATASSRAQTGGNAPVAGKTSQDGFTVIDLMNPISGVQAGRSKIRAFQVYSTTGCRIMLKIFRPLLLSYEFVGASNLVYASPQQVSTLRCDIPVQDGDLVGFTTYDVGAGAVDYTDDNPNLQASVAYIGDVGTVLKANGTVLHYVRSIRVIGVPSDDLPEDFKTGNTYVPVVTRAGGPTERSSAPRGPSSTPPPRRPRR